ncbi:hypothetical protein VTN00DRAFT_1436 [Thermoascus crustaceus]|uniref:uncharacterized protein n=1 Tax=Thermoascus crustaceus TaxID=5088 RepID=UPI0037434846
MKLTLTIALCALSARTFVAAVPAPIPAPAPAAAPAPLKLPGHGTKDTYADDYTMGPTDNGNSDLFNHDTLQHAVDNNHPDNKNNNVVGDTDMDDIHDLNNPKKMQNMDGKQPKGKVNLSLAGQRVPLPSLGGGRGRGPSRRSKLSRRDGVTSLLPGLAPVSVAGSGVGQVFGKVGSFGTALTDKVLHGGTPGVHQPQNGVKPASGR